MFQKVFSYAMVVAVVGMVIFAAIGSGGLILNGPQVQGTADIVR